MLERKKIKTRVEMDMKNTGQAKKLIEIKVKTKRDKN